MKSDSQLSRREKNLILAKKNYLKKKEERQQLEKENEELTHNQMKLLEDMSSLEYKLLQIQTVLNYHDQCNYLSFGKEDSPKRKWNEIYHQEVISHQHPKMRIKQEEGRIVMAH